jgi:hypothetical protein
MIDYRPQADRILVARLSGAAGRLSRWGALDDAQADAGAAKLRELAGGRGDLLAEVAGLALGTAESKGPEYVAQGEAIARLCRAAGADLGAISEWTEEAGRRLRAGLRLTGECAARYGRSTLLRLVASGREQAAVLPDGDYRKPPVSVRAWSAWAKWPLDSSALMAASSAAVGAAGPAGAAPGLPGACQNGERRSAPRASTP